MSSLSSLSQSFLTCSGCVVLEAVLFRGHHVPTLVLSDFDLPLPGGGGGAGVDVDVDLIALQ